MTNRWTLSTVPVTVSLTFSVVDLELSGVTLSATSGIGVSVCKFWHCLRKKEDVLSLRSLRLASDMFAGFRWG